MSHPIWQRFLAAGAELAETQPAFFPSAVAFLEVMTKDTTLHALVHSAVTAPSPLIFDRPIAVWTPRDLADAMCLVEPRLAELEHELDTALARMCVTERTQAAQWARETHRGTQPTLPSCVADLFALLVAPLEESP